MKKIILTFLFCHLFCIAGFSQKAVQIDEFQVAGCDEYLARMDAMINYSWNNPTAKVYVFVYEGRYPTFSNSKGKSENMLPTFGQAKARIKSMKEYISKMRKYSLEKFIFVNAGFRENYGVEIWGVPGGVVPPQPSPTLAKMKYRKGKSYGYCLDCCE